MEQIKLKDERKAKSMSRTQGKSFKIQNWFLFVYQIITDLTKFIDPSNRKECWSNN